MRRAAGSRLALASLLTGLSVFRPRELREVRLPTAEGLGLLISLSRGLRARGGKLVLLNAPADVYEVFEQTRLVDVLDVRPLGQPEAAA